MRFFQCAYVGSALLAVLTGSVLSILGIMDFSDISRIADWLARDGDADSITQDLITGMQPRLLQVGLAYFATGALLYLSRKQISRLFSNSGPDKEIVASSVGWTWWVIMGAIVAVALVVRLPYLDYPMSHDGAFSYVNYSSFGPVVIATKYFNPNNHILHTHLTWVSQILFQGTSEAVLRVPALLAGLALIVATGHVAREVDTKAHGDTGAGYIAASLTASSLIWIEYSVLSRGYSLLALLCVLWVFISIRLMREDTDRWWPWFVAVGVAAYYTMPTALFFHAGLFLFSLAIFKGQALVKAVVTNLLVGVGAVLLYLPVLIPTAFEDILASHSGATWGRIGIHGFREFVNLNFQTLVQLGKLLSVDQIAIMSFAMFVGLVVFLITASRGLLRPFVNMMLSLLLGAGIVLLLLRNAPLARSWYMYVPLLSVISAVGLSSIVKWLNLAKANALMAATAIIVSATPVVFSERVPAVFSPERHPLYDIESIAIHLKKEVSDGAVVLVDNSSLPILQYYHMQQGVNFGDRIRELKAEERQHADYVACARAERFCLKYAKNRRAIPIYTTRYGEVYALPLS